MFTDMAGSTASAQANESDALKLRDEQAGLVRPLFAAHQGREIKSMGDGFLAEFDSALRAVQCAIDIQQHLHERNSQPGATPIRLRIVMGNRFPRKCACRCERQIPRDPAVRYVVDFAASRPYPAYLREHSPVYGTYHRRAQRTKDDLIAVPGYRPASELLSESREDHDVPHSEADASPTPEAGRPWASGQLVFNAGLLCIFRLDDRSPSAAMALAQPDHSVPAAAPRFRYMVLIG